MARSLGAGRSTRRKWRAIDEQLEARWNPPSRGNDDDVQHDHDTVPVMLDEVLAALNVRAGGRYVDYSSAAAGHAEAILEQAQPGGSLARHRCRRGGD